MTVGDDSFDDKNIIAYWGQIASIWTGAIRGRRIESREKATNQAIIGAILDRAPESVLDLGCGEGWLCHELQRRGITTIGVDAVPELIDHAKENGPGDFRVLSYQAVAAGALETRTDVVVCNFSLLGKEAVREVLRVAPSLMAPDGAMIVQTLHPLLAPGDEPYEDGWRLSPWVGFGSEFSKPSPWYFRTLGSWISSFVEHRLKIVEIREPMHPETGRPASVIFIATVD